ncbi:urea ABC transporter ATP-binding subunit UrtE [Aestuariivirga sp.]|uniref:urea ABC transporter ATP-binding subunit UrtE n=1 Tax=Aestuariivirga sp. TaxID=2650926 RepID=UPI0039E39419
MLKVDAIDLYYGASRALSDVSLVAEAGKVTCILGRNGVGKTSLIRAIAGLTPVRKGTLTFDGKDITKLPSAERARSGIALVPQGREIFTQLTVEENLKTGFACLPREHRSIPLEIYELFPVLKDMLHRRGGDLSGGQQQQLAIGRALVTRPRVLLLDEPTEGIQPSIIKDIERIIALLRDRGTMAIVLVEQYFEFAKRLADNFIILNRGKTVLEGERVALEGQEVKAFLTV